MVSTQLAEFTNSVSSDEIRALEDAQPELWPWQAEPYRLWSLEDIMLKFPATLLLAAWNNVKHAQEGLWCQWSKGFDLQTNKDDLQEMLGSLVDSLKLLEESCKELPLGKVFKTQLARVLKQAESPFSLEALNTSVADLGHSLLAAFSEHYFLMIPSTECTFYEKHPFPSANAFPSAEYDMTECCKCVALDRTTAAVFHAMRITEIGLQVLAASLSVNFANRQWEHVINDCEGAVRNLGQSKATNPGWKDDEQFYSEALSHFRNLKNAWRNYVAHSHQKYTKSEAFEITSNVISFMSHLGTKLAETP